MEAFEAFRRSAFHVLTKNYRTGGLGVAVEAFSDAYDAARVGVKPEARGFFERWFIPCLVSPAPQDHGFVTGFYEPVARASPVRTETFRYPLYARPPDLIELTAENRAAGMDPSCRFGRATSSGIVEYYDRAAIEKGALAGRGLEIAWLSDPVDLFFIHVQGAARLQMTDGGTVRVTYAAKSGHPFTGPGGILRDLGEIPAQEITMQSIRAWLDSHPGRRDEILHRNRSFIFFREAPVDDPALGPVAAAKVPLTPGRSIAVDRELHTFGTPFFIDAPSLAAFDGSPFRRLMIAQDTGSAIVGAARGDLFTGSGHEAGEIAGVIRHPADFYALLPRTLVENALSENAAR
jgi:membrane-bound lytic murein transglycosylase A